MTLDLGEGVYGKFRSAKISVTYRSSTWIAVVTICRTSEFETLSRRRQLSSEFDDALSRRPIEMYHAMLPFLSRCLSYSDDPSCRISLIFYIPLE